jgi:hypothetical protein
MERHSAVKKIKNVPIVVVCKRKLKIIKANTSATAPLPCGEGSGERSLIKTIKE